jgi:hypothetical protein
MSELQDQTTRELQRAAEREQRQHEVSEAYKVISRALNRGDTAMVLDAIGREHSTLLGRLGNVVMEAVRERDGDGRLCDFNAPMAEKATIFAKVSDVRQRFI